MTFAPGRTLPTVVVAGASGFVGQALGRALARRAHLVGLSRQARAPRAGDPYTRWRIADLFSLIDAEAAVEGADIVIYLVHSMLPSARLNQGNFRDFDLVCADNLGRAAAAAGVRQIVYLGGLVPRDTRLSEHLASRVEVEHALAASGVPVTSLHAGLILGADGSSFQIMRRLVERLPAMLLPSWADTRTQPVALADVVALLAFAVDEPRCLGRRFDVGAPEVVTYREMMAITAERLGIRRRMVGLPLITPGLSRLWLSLVTGAPRELARPLVQSLRHEMIAEDDELARLAGRRMTPVRDAIAAALAEQARRAASPRAFRRHPAGADDRTVRSVQRMELPATRDAAWAADEYARVLPRIVPGILRAEVDATRTCRFYLAGTRRLLLELSFAPARSAPDRQLFYITGGLLARPTRRGRFELRQIAGGRTLVAAIHEFEPSLPWPLYRATQALVHAWVMRRFARAMLRTRAGGRPGTRGSSPPTPAPSCTRTGTAATGSPPSRA